MNAALWAVQGLIAATFFAAGAFKLFTPLSTLSQKMRWVQMYPPWMAKLIGLAEIAGALGLILPWYLRIEPRLTPIAASLLAVLMIGAARTHLVLKESPLPAIIPGVLSALVAWGRM